MKHLNRYILIVVFMLAGIRSEAISIYEISYEFTKLVDFPKYKAMLVRYGNGTGFMRVRYTSKDGKEVYVVNMEFDEVEGRSKIDGLPHLTLQFKGKNPVYIVNTSKSKQNEAYNPDLLWFKKLTTDKNFKPWGVTSQNMDGTWEQGKTIMPATIPGLGAIIRMQLSPKQIQQLLSLPLRQKSISSWWQTPMIHG
ncbi:MAG: hypothetical protein IPP93_04000 [Chitinophagaceae bacterium]|nr:hypothetical protein [Chitinophagaceae bacterium]